MPGTTGTGRATAWPGFLCQQAAEKALKAFLVLRGDEDTRGHSVGDLCKRAAAHESAFADLRADGAKLDRFYVPTRYPDALPGGVPFEAFDGEDADWAIARAERIIDAVQGAFGRA